MDKNKILESARNERLRGHEYENKAFSGSIEWSSFLTLLLGALLAIVKWIIEKSFDFGIMSMIAALLGIQGIFEGVKARKLYMLGVGIFCSIAAIAFIYGFFVGLFS